MRKRDEFEDDGRTIADMSGIVPQRTFLPVLRLGGYAIHVPYALQWKMEKAEESGSFPRLLRAKSFSDIAGLI